MPSISGLWARLRDKRYREEFVATLTRRMIPLQISAIMRARRINQKELADASGLTQGAISRAANPNYGNLTVNTIIRVAAGLDVAFIGLFVPFSRLESFFRNLSEEGLAHVATFAEEDQQGADVPSTSMSAANSDKCATLSDATGRGRLQMVRAEINPPPQFDKSGDPQLVATR
jgi:transcriptional regulator with XRE-family HTH domain